MLSISVHANIQPALHALGVAEHQQVPFATALMLTRLGLTAQAKAREELPVRFPDAMARGGHGMRWVSRGIRVEQATKANQQAVVYTDQWFMSFQEAGGTKRPLQGFANVSAFQAVTHTAWMAIPHGKLKHGGIRWTPSQALKEPRTFVNQFRNSWWFIGQRIHTRSYPLAVLYVLKPTVQVEPRFGLAETTQAVVRDSDLAREFNSAMTEAVRTSR
jgi:hypothetical protein